ncbi:DUF1365 domain-containing protein [Mesobaculum littorinae]|uniref:DUF1365 domain-containing protein n=1 Tax=Mesobaculum littorinae TaxID=2486419 RepID=A0A438AHT4_9RHOB|nr:DUF1365 domain-containing protein [Mesobaculum littorinae]
MVEHVPAETWHGRHGSVRNGFRYGIDYICIDPEVPAEILTAPTLFTRNRPGVWSLRDRDHGGAPGRGRGAPWVREALAQAGLDVVTDGRLLLLAQPRVLGHVFNPVSFWLAHDAEGRLRVVLAEVSNTFGDRHSYLCHRDDLAPLGTGDEVEARKVFHVSPFQPVSGRYRFRFDIAADRIDIRIAYRSDAGGEGLVATLSGPRRPLTTRAILASSLRRPFGSRRVLTLIHWQALRLWRRGAGYRQRPKPPDREVSR